MINDCFNEISNEDLKKVRGGSEPVFPIIPGPEDVYRDPIEDGNAFCCLDCGYRIYNITPTTCLSDVCPCCGSTAGWVAAE